MVCDTGARQDLLVAVFCVMFAEPVLSHSVVGHSSLFPKYLFSRQRNFMLNMFVFSSFFYFSSCPFLVNTEKSFLSVVASGLCSSSSFALPSQIVFLILQFL